MPTTSKATPSPIGTENLSPNVSAASLPQLRPQKSILIRNKETRSMATVSTASGTNKKVTFFDFKGLMAPVFTCFKNDSDHTLELQNIDQYAKWLKSKRINGVLVNSITGEGPALGVNERKLHAEIWWNAAVKHDLVLMLQIGGAPLPDVMELARHAEELGVHAVLCLPELFYKPKSIEQLIGYCKIISRECATRPFFYYHIPNFTHVNFKMNEFCHRAEERIPSFFGLQYSSTDLEMGAKCLNEGRVVLLGHDTMLASGMLLGFDSALMSFFNTRPDLGWRIYDAMQNNNLAVAKQTQKLVNALIGTWIIQSEHENWVGSMKNWFNSEEGEHSAGFSAGPSRKFY